MAGHQDSLRSVRQCFACAKDAAMVGRDQAIALGKDGSDSQAGDSCGGR